MIPIQKVIKQIIQNNINNKKFLLSYLQIMWKHIVGDNVAQMSRVNKLEDDTLEIIVYDSKLLKILPKLEEDIMNNISDLIGKSILRKINFKKGKKAIEHAAEHKLVDDNQKLKGTDLIAEADLINDDELKELFKRAYSNYKKAIKNI